MARRAPTGGAGGTLKRALVGFDGSAESQRALRVALAFAAQVQGEAGALVVVSPPAHTEPPGEVERMVEERRRELEALVRQAEPCPVLVV